MEKTQDSYKETAVKMKETNDDAVKNGVETVVQAECPP